MPNPLLIRVDVLLGAKGPAKDKIKWLYEALSILDNNLEIVGDGLAGAIEGLSIGGLDHAGVDEPLRLRERDPGMALDEFVEAQLSGGRVAHGAR